MDSSFLKGHKRFFLIYFALLIVVLTVIGIMRWLGYYLIETGTEFFLFGLLLCSGLVALIIFLTGKIERKALKILAGTAGVAVTFVIAVLMIIVFNVVMQTSLPSYFNSFTSPSGKTAVVLRQFSADPDRISERVGGEPQGVYEELGFSYTAYPRVLTFFYDSDQPGEGELEIGCASSALLKYEWTDDDTLHLFIESPQPGDSGEYSLTLE